MRIGCCGQDPHKFARAQELIRMNEEIKQAKKVRCWLLTSCKGVPRYRSDRGQADLQAFEADDKLIDDDE